MTNRRWWMAAAAALVLAAGGADNGTRVQAQRRVSLLPADDGGHVALGLAIRRLNSVGVFAQTDAHPDDENNALIAWLTRGQGMRAAVLTMTRGNGGQNEIGPELFEDLAVVRTSELLSAHRLDGAEQYFGRAIDFGFSFSTDETFAKWGRQEILSDLVRHFRTLRPDVVLAMSLTGEGGGQHHQAVAQLTKEAFRAAADPTQFPEQLKEGLRPWQVKKFYVNGGPPPGALGAVGVTAARPNAPPRIQTPREPGGLAVDANVFDPLLGRTYNEIGWEARSYHKCQGASQVMPLPGPAPARYVLSDSVVPAPPSGTETGMFDGIDTSIPGLAQYAGPKPPEALTAGLAAIASQGARASEVFDTMSDAATQAPIVAGLAAVRALRAQLASMNLGEMARYEIDVRLAAKERDYQAAALAAHGLRFKALADDGLLVDGQPVGITLFASNNAGAAVEFTEASVAGFDGPSRCGTASIERGGAFSCELSVRVPFAAKLTAPYWSSMPDMSRSVFDPDVPFGAPFRPSPFRATFRVRIGGQDVSAEMPVMFRYQQDIFTGEKQMELHVVPMLSVRMTPSLAMVPAAAAGRAAPTTREIQVAVTSGIKGAVDTAVALDVPAGWSVTPASAPLAFTREDESRTARFTVTVPAAAKTGAYTLRATARTTGNVLVTSTSGYQVVEYPHIQRRHVINAAETSVRVVDVKTVPGLRIGYIVGVGDQVPPALEQLGARVTLLGSDDLAWGDLSRFDVVMTGVRAYERRDDLRAYNRRLIDFAERGGTVLVQYNKFEFNQAQYGPWPAAVSSGRVTDERAPVAVLAPTHPAFTFPNRIDDRTWSGWVQERGLYFLGEKDARYVDLVSLEDSFPFNKGVKRGALVEARVGKGRWLYVGLGLWRQVPAGVDGAYQLLANLIALPKAPAGAAK